MAKGQSIIDELGRTFTVGDLVAIADAAHHRNGQAGTVCKVDPNTMLVAVQFPDKPGLFGWFNPEPPQMQVCPIAWPTSVVNVKDPRGFDVYIGRPIHRSRDVRVRKGSVLGNPYRGEDCEGGAAQAVRLYRQWLWGHAADEGPIESALMACRGKRLGCWCKVKGDEPCHGDVIVDWLAENALGVKP